MILEKDDPYGLPFHIIKHLPYHSMIEWYMNRNHQNPLYNIDYLHLADRKTLDHIMQDILSHDKSLYKLSPSLNMVRILSMYQPQHMTFPVYIYSQYEDPFIAEDMKESLPSIPFTFVHGEIDQAVKRLPDNFTYIFSNLESIKSAYSVLEQKFCHILIASDYSYNYSDFNNTFKYPIESFQRDNIRVGIINAVDRDQLVSSMMHLIK